MFNAVGDGGRDLFLLDLKTKKVTRFDATQEYEVDPEFSPDGKSIVYAAGVPGDRADHIFVRSLGGKTVNQFTKGDVDDASPAYSPDGSLIVFTRDKTYNPGGSMPGWDGGGVVCLMNSDGTNVRQITKEGTIAMNPHFSTDGRTILFFDESGLWTVAADGSGPPRSLGVSCANSRDATYSPDGLSIAFSAGKYSPDCRIFIARTDGTGARKLTPRVADDLGFPEGGYFDPAFTPGGQRMVFFLESWPNGPTGVPKRGLWEIDLQKNRQREIAGYELFDDPLNWKPNPAGAGKKQ